MHATLHGMDSQRGKEGPEDLETGGDWVNCWVMIPDAFEDWYHEDKIDN